MAKRRSKKPVKRKASKGAAEMGSALVASVAAEERRSKYVSPKPDDPCYDVDWPHLIRMGIEERDKYLGHVNRLVQQYVGMFYKQGFSSENMLANHPAELVAILIPQLASAAPYIKVSAGQIGVPDHELFVRQSVMNKWAQATDFRALQEELATAYCFLCHFWFVGMEKRFADEAESGDPALIPVAMMIDWEDKVWDPCAKKYERSLFRGHRVRTTRREAIERAEAHPEEKWDVDAIRSMNAATQDDRREAGRYVDDSRDEIEFWQIWVPTLRNDKKEYPQESGFHGKILTVTLEQLAVPTLTHFLREPYPFFGPRWGPYGIGGAYVVPGQPIPLSPLVSDALQSESLNDIDTAISSSDYRYKRFLATLGNRTDVDELLANIEHDGIANFPGSEDLAKHVQPIEIFGSTRWMHATRLGRREALDRKSGIFQAMLGNPNAGTTATADSIAAKANTTRFSHHVTKNQASFTHLLRTVMWYMGASEDFEEQAGPDALAGIVDPLTGKRLRREHTEGVTFRGGPPEKGGKWVDDFDRYLLNIDIGTAALSAEERQAKELQGLQFFLQLQTVLAQSPAINGERVNRMVANAFNMPELLTLVDVAAAQQIEAYKQVAALAGGGKAPQQNTSPQSGMQAPQPQRSHMETRLNITTPPVTAPANKPGKFPQYGNNGQRNAQSGA